MDIENLFVDSKWSIITELAKKPLSPSELAKKTNTTLSNISAQIRLLEALDIVKEEKLGNVAKGEARKLYSLKKEISRAKHTVSGQEDYSEMPTGKNSSLRP